MSETRIGEQGERAVRHVAMLDVGKTNIKLAIARPDGQIVAQASTANRVTSRPGEPWSRHDLAASEDWVLAALSDMAGRFEIDRIVASGHGSSGVLVLPGDLERDEPRLPMIDYETIPPAHVDAAYKAGTGDFFDRGSDVMHGATHQARQMLWVESEDASAFLRAEALLGVPQYWAWRLSGETSAEITYQAAQSDLWNVHEDRPSRIVGDRNWHRLLPRLRPAFTSLGRIRESIARRTGLPEHCEVLVGIHDSSANFYRYQAAGLSQMTVVSTGTWIVALSDHGDIGTLDPARGMTLNADIEGRPLAGSLTMGGREFAAIAGEAPNGVTASGERLQGLIDRQCFALPSFGLGDGLFPGSAGRGRIEGALACSEDRVSLAVLTTALLANECLIALCNRGTIIIDGAFLKDPLYAPIIAGLNPDKDVLFSREANGVAAGAALLATHLQPDRRVSIDLQRARPIELRGLETYAREWRRRTHANAGGTD